MSDFSAYDPVRRRYLRGATLWRWTRFRRFAARFKAAEDWNILYFSDYSKTFFLITTIDPKSGVEMAVAEYRGRLIQYPAPEQLAAIL